MVDVAPERRMPTSPPGSRHSGYAVEFSRLQRFSKVKGKNGRYALGNIVLPEPAPDHQNVVARRSTISRARFAVCCPRTSLKSTRKLGFAEELVASTEVPSEPRCPELMKVDDVQQDLTGYTSRP